MHKFIWCWNDWREWSVLGEAGRKGGGDEWQKDRRSWVFQVDEVLWFGSGSCWTVWRCWWAPWPSQNFSLLDTEVRSHWRLDPSSLLSPSDPSWHSLHCSSSSSFSSSSCPSPCGCSATSRSELVESRKELSSSTWADAVSPFFL